MIITGKPRQTISDIAIQHYGSISGVEWLIADNEDILQPEDLEGVQIVIRDDEVKDQRIVNYFENKIIVTE
jgi:hypothetical protein